MPNEGFILGLVLAYVQNISISFLNLTTNLNLKGDKIFSTYDDTNCAFCIFLDPCTLPLKIFCSHVSLKIQVVFLQYELEPLLEVLLLLLRPIIVHHLLLMEFLLL